MKFCTLLFALISFNLLAHEACVETLPGPLEELIKLQRELHWHAASDEDVKYAKCLRTKNFTVDEMRNWMKENDGERINTTVHGISFEDESEENINAFKHLTTAVDFISRPDPERQKSFTSSCKKVQCAMEEIFGKSTATHLLFMHRKFGMNGSHLSYINTDPWKKEELDILLLALSDFPDGILPIRDNKQMVRFKRGYMRNGGDNTIANAVMEFFDPFDKQSSWQKRTTVTHELAHVLATESKVDDAPIWTQLGGWEETTKIEDGKKVSTSTNSKNRRAVSKYGEANQYEDFAEAVVSYRYNPKLLKSVSPEKYELIKTVIFDNVEYTSREACENPRRMSEELRNAAIKLSNQWIATEDDIQEIASHCSVLAIEKLASEVVDLSHEDFQSCYQKSLDKKSKGFLLEAASNHPYKDYIGPLIRNSKPMSFGSTKVRQLKAQAEQSHRSLLRKEIAQALKTSFRFADDCSERMLSYTYQGIDEKLMDKTSAYSQQENFEKLARKTCENIIEKRSYLRKKLNYKISDEEIENEVNELIK